MRARILLVVCLCCVGVIAVAAAPRAKRGSGNVQPVQAPPGWWTDGKGNWKSVGVGPAITKGAGMNAMMAPAAAQAAPNSWAVNVKSDLSLNGGDQTLYQNMATILSAVTAVPPTRTAEFAATLNNNITPTPWTGSITQVTDDGNGGNLVDVLIGALFYDQNGNWQGKPFTGGYYEQWDVDANGNATFVQAFDPGNLAGQPMPAFID